MLLMTENDEELEEERYLTSLEVSIRLHLDHETIKRWIRNKELPGYKFGRHWRVRRDDYFEFVRKRKNIYEVENHRGEE